MLTRRHFLRSSGVVALSSSVPGFLTKSIGNDQPTQDGNILVVIELDGGNDALNTIVPHRDPEYAKLRPKLKQDPKQLIKLTDAVGLHANLKPLDEILQAGHLAVVAGVGYPNPNRSHFESRAVWYTARFSEEEHQVDGWLGRAINDSERPLYSIGGSIPMALRGRRAAAASFNSLDELKLAKGDLLPVAPGPDDSSLESFVRRQSVSASELAAKLSQVKAESAPETFPRSALNNHLKLIAQLLKVGQTSPVYYTRQNGYDTHSNQLGSQANLFNELSTAIRNFYRELKAMKMLDRVTILVFSEFGRTIRENGSAGTDHGTAGVSFAIGSKVKAGLLGKLPSLTDLDEDEPKHTVDFRAVYAEILSKWLKLPTDGLGKDYGKIELFR